MARKKTHEEFVAEVTALVGDEYIVLGIYKTNKIKLEMLHKKCNTSYMARPNSFLTGDRCRDCSGLKKKTTDEFKKEVFDLVGDEYEVKDKYVNNYTKINLTHKDCGQPYLTSPNNFLRGKRCTCINVNKKTTDEFKKEVFDLVGDEYEVTEEYINSYTKINLLHKECGENYSVRPGGFLSGSRCPRCQASKGERKIGDWLNERGIQFIPQKPIKYNKNKLPLKLDFYVQGVAIEYDGEQHFESIKYFGGESALRETQQRDRIKNKYCADNGIPLIRIPYWDFDNVDAILTDKLLPLLNKRAA